MNRPNVPEQLSACNSEYIDKCQWKYEKYIDVLTNKNKKLDKRIQELESENKLYKKAFGLSCNRSGCVKPNSTFEECEEYYAKGNLNCGTCRKDYFLEKAKGENND